VTLLPRRPTRLVYLSATTRLVCLLVTEHIDVASLTTVDVVGLSLGDMARPVCLSVMGHDDATSLMMMSGAVMTPPPRVGRQQRWWPPSDAVTMTAGAVGRPLGTATVTAGPAGLDLGPMGLDLG
jgi:hypothetical protein